MFRSFLSVLFIYALGFASPAAAKDVKDFLGVPGPVTIGDLVYALSWSSNPQSGYFKQEYLPEFTTTDRYNSMVVLEFLETDQQLSDVVAAQIEMINKRKINDPVANFSLLRNQKANEIILDFLLSSKDKSGEYIIEWNGYRYAEGQLNGQSGVKLFALSERAYGNEAAKRFLQGLKDFKAKRLADLTRAPIPAFGTLD